VDSLQGLDHSTITYQPFVRNFYLEHPEVATMTPE
jgi:hypothetical protein